MDLAISPAPWSVDANADTNCVIAPKTKLAGLRSWPLIWDPIFLNPAPNAWVEEPPLRIVSSICSRASFVSNKSPKIGILAMPFKTPPVTPSCFSSCFSFEIAMSIWEFNFPYVSADSDKFRILSWIFLVRSAYLLDSSAPNSLNFLPLSKRVLSSWSKDVADFRFCLEDSSFSLACFNCFEDKLVIPNSWSLIFCAKDAEALYAFLLSWSPLLRLPTSLTIDLKALYDSLTDSVKSSTLVFTPSKASWSWLIVWSTFWIPWVSNLANGFFCLKVSYPLAISSKSFLTSCSFFGSGDAAI